MSLERSNGSVGAAAISILGFAAGAVGFLVDDLTLAALGLTALMAALLASHRGLEAAGRCAHLSYGSGETLGLDLSRLLLWTLLGIIAVTATFSVALELTVGRPAGMPMLERLPPMLLALLLGAGLGTILGMAIGAAMDRRP
jgi:hypothetical protein